jgi:hypothetical protein
MLRWLWGWRRNIPTERKILGMLYDMYRNDFPRVDGKSTEAWVNIDIDAVAKKLAVSAEFLHGYLLFMEMKYRYQTAENTYRSLYVFRGARQCGISLPYAASILAGHTEDAWRHRLTLSFAVAAVVISLVGVAIQAWDVNQRSAIDVRQERRNIDVRPSNGLKPLRPKSE